MDSCFNFMGKDMLLSARRTSWILLGCLLGLVSLSGCGDESDAERITNACINLCKKSVSCVDGGAPVDCQTFCKEQGDAQELEQQLRNAPEACLDAALDHLDCLIALECPQFLDEQESYCVEEAMLAAKHCE